MDHNLTRSRWAAIGAAVAVTLGAGGIGLVSATSPSDATAYIPIEPCRVADTRAGAFNIGDRSTPIGADEIHVVAAHGDHGECTGIPTTATGLQLNVTALNASAATFLTIWGSGDRPNSSNLNPRPGQPPIPNSVTTGLTPTGRFNIYNSAGNVNVIVDIVGYYADHHHDDRYYTRAEVDLLKSFAVTNPVMGTGSFSTNLVVATVDVVAPAPGGVVVNYSVIIGGAADDRVTCGAGTFTTLTGSDIAGKVVTDIPVARAVVAGTVLVPVPAGTTTINLVCRPVIGATLNAFSGTITAIYTPG
jgi:hypothetical protein